MTIRMLGFSCFGYFLALQLAIPICQAAEYESREVNSQGDGQTDPNATPLPQRSQHWGYANSAQDRASTSSVPAQTIAVGSQGRTATPYGRAASRVQAGQAARSDGGADVERALKLTPVQKGVDISTPAPEEIAKCRIYARKIGAGVGYVVEDPNGLILRRFLDTNGDNKLDQWCYYKDGIEVYRDIDTDSNSKADQYRWFNTAGSRWGVDKNEDGVIDYWQAISPEEVTAEVVAALANQDVARFSRVLLSPEELETLGLGSAKAQALGERVRLAVGKFQDLLRQRTGIGEKTKWTHFSGNHPGLVPAGTDGSVKDIQVYENAVAVFQTGSEHGQLQIGTMVKVGDGWRVVDAPQFVAEGQALASTGFFFQISQSVQSQSAVGLTSEKSQEALVEMEKLDAAANKSSQTDELIRINLRRADLLEKMADEAGKPEDRAVWLRQLADMIGAAVQTGAFPDGDKRLQSLFEKVQRSDQDRPLAGRIRWAQLTAEYGLAVQAKGVDLAKLQTEWLKKLEQYVNDYPKSPDAAEALLQIGLAQEFAGQESEAKKWYSQIVSDFPESLQAKKAAGGKLRLSSVGKVLAFQGKSVTGELINLAKYRGQVVLIQYWSTTCEPCRADMAVLKDLLGKYPRNFSVIGVSLDRTEQEVSAFLKENRPQWAQVFEPGGMESRPALELGIMTLPTMLLIDQEGKVVNRNVGATEIEGELKRLIR